MNQKSALNKTLLPDTFFCSSCREGGRGGSWGVATGGIFFVSMAIPFLLLGVMRHPFSPSEEGSSSTDVREAELSARCTNTYEDKYAPTETGACRVG